MGQMQTLRLQRSIHLMTVPAIQKVVQIMHNRALLMYQVMIQVLPVPLLILIQTTHPVKTRPIRMHLTVILQTVIQAVRITRTTAVLIPGPKKKDMAAIAAAITVVITAITIITALTITATTITALTITAIIIAIIMIQQTAIRAPTITVLIISIKPLMNMKQPEKITRYHLICLSNIYSLCVEIQVNYILQYS